MFNQPKLSEVIIYLALSAALFVGKDYAAQAAVWLGAILFILTPVFLAGGVVSGIYWVIYNYKTWAIREIRTRNETELVLALNALAKLDEGQLYALMHTNDLKTLLSGIERRTIPFEGYNIDLMWLIGYVRDDEWLPPTRDLEHTDEKDWATALIRAWERKGYVRKGSGPYSARWVNKPAALQMIGMDMNAVET